VSAKKSRRYGSTNSAVVRKVKVSSKAAKKSAATGSRQTTLGEFAKAQAAAQFIFSKTKLRPKIALVLGSGLGAFADEFAGAVKIPYGDIPYFPRSTAIGHAGKMVIGEVGDTPVIAMQGRVHLYEGYSIHEVAFPVRVFARLGVPATILTNAAGGILRELTQGRLVLISDHINLQGANPLSGPNDERFGPRFPDMTSAYDKKFRAIAAAEAARAGTVMPEGVYAALAGPSYETPAEIRYLRAIGADLVGMSTVPEVIAARHSNIRVLGISCVTNAAAGVIDGPLIHAEVLEVAERVKGQFIALLRAVIPKIAAELR
jgi:purine-nucleoside phosphorylase